MWNGLPHFAFSPPLTAGLNLPTYTSYGSRTCTTRGPSGSRLGGGVRALPAGGGLGVESAAADEEVAARASSLSLLSRWNQAQFAPSGSTFSSFPPPDTDALRLSPVGGSWCPSSSFFSAAGRSGCGLGL